jgi:DNA-binding response OmpR family regulator
LILLDVEMPGTNGYMAMERLKATDVYKEIPVIFLTAMDDAESEVEGLNLGAVDYIHKPFIGSLLTRRIGRHLAVIDGKQELMALDNSIKYLRGSNVGDINQKVAVDEETIQELITKDEILSRMGREIRAPLNSIIEMIEAAIIATDLASIKHYLGIANADSRLIMEIVNNTLDPTAGE